MKLAAIDVGTNSVKLLVAKHEGGRLETLVERVEITRLGEGLGKKQKIALEAADRTLEMLAEYKRIAEEQGVERIAAVGTKALRTATNAKDFLLRCEYEAGIKIRIITERDEARLAFRGAANATRRSRAMVLDIGGGSAQLSFGRKAKLLWHTSMPLGAVVLTERHVRHDPPAAGDLDAMREEIRKHLTSALASLGDRWTWHAGDLVGVGGTVATLAALAPEGSPDLGLPMIEKIAERLAGMTLDVRKQMPGLDPARADIIVAGATVLVEAMKALRFKILIPSRRGLRHGLALELASGRGR